MIGINEKKIKKILALFQITVSAVFRETQKLPRTLKRRKRYDTLTSPINA